MAIKVKFQSSFGTARYPHISKPDTVGKYADNKFKTKLVTPLGDPGAQKLIDIMNDAAKQAHGASGLKKHLPYVIDEDANEVVFTFKTQYAPAIFDSRGKPIKGGSIVGPGSVIRVAGTLVEFDKGITAQFNQVQVKELNGFGECVFDDVEDGYEFDGSEDSSSFSDTDEGESTDGRSSALDI